jgi:hypothetical protein
MMEDYKNNLLPFIKKNTNFFKKYIVSIWRIFFRRLKK